MTIDLGLPPRRHRVSFIEVDPPAEAQAAFAERGLLTSRCEEKDLKDRAYISGVTAVVLIQKPDDPGRASKLLRTYGGHLLDFDCRVFVRVAPPSENPPTDNVAFIVAGINSAALPVAGLVGSFRHQSSDGGTPPFPHVNVVFDNMRWSEIANRIVAYPAGEMPSASLAIDGGDDLSESQQILMRRAFWNCAELHLIRADDGHSGVYVYRAYAELEEGLLGRWPLPYFVKIGNRQKIFKEFENYEGQVDPYIPFHLGPHLVRERCCLGAHDGVIVGDFVEESESLSVCAQAGRAATAIACLFDRTLRGWHRFAREETWKPSTAMRLPGEIDTTRVKRAMTLGASKSLKDLQAILDALPARPLLVGPIHGDLHASNVRVRGGEAIVIDFLASKPGPLLRDPATLEASLLVECLTDSKDIASWMRSVEDLYRADAFVGASFDSHPKSPGAWFRGCVRQVRMYARDMERADQQYALMLAVALLHKASKNKRTTPEDADRRAAAYCFGERLLMSCAPRRTL